MNIDSYAVGLSLIGLIVIASIAGLFLVRKVIHLERLKSFHEVGGYLLSVVGTLYAVLLGLVVVDAMTKFQTARNVVESEANSLADVFILAGRLSPDKGTKVRLLCKKYADEVVDVEWPLLARGDKSIKARTIAVQLMKEVSDFEPVTENQKAIYPVLIEESIQLWDNRRLRTNLADFGIPLIEWNVLILGGVVTIVFTYFFGIESLCAQIIMTSMVSLLISLNLYLVALFGAPFSGDLQVSPQSFQIDKTIFNNQLGLAPNALPEDLKL
jgi:hypothetical protein